MPEQNSRLTGGPLARLFALPNEHPAKTLAVALILCLVCSTLVSTAAILLKPRQLENMEVLAKQREILRAVDLFQDEAGIGRAFKQVETRLVDLTTGEYATHIDAADYHYEKALHDPTLRIDIPAQQDIARVQAIARYAPVYLFRDQGALKYVVIPVYGYGLWSTMRAYLAINANGRDIAGISFYQHGETPGLGGEITNPRWQASWRGKQIYNAQGQVQLALSKNAAGRHQIDALSGATITSNGVTSLIHFWLGDQGYGPYLKRHLLQDTLP